ncbi:porin [Candidatus Spongiihabitans sp.]|uniref:porin n=1 Tax=Candidatus Spongiihabitans sp. TaxID=3101308 RepID=UPI003C7E0522
MNKKLIAAIAATTMAGAIGFASVAAAAEFNWYGSLRAGAVYSDVDAGDGSNWDLGATGNDGSVGGQGLYSRIGIKASTDLGNGSSAGLHLERGVGSTLSVRHTNVWVGGGWGKLTLGQQGNPYRSARNWDQTYFMGGQIGSDDGGSRIEGVKYSSSLSGPFQFTIMATGNDGAGKSGVDRWIAATSFDLGAVAVNLAHNTRTDDVGMDNTAIGVNGSAGDFGWYLTYQNATDNVGDNDMDSLGGFVSLGLSDNDTLYLYHVNHDKDDGASPTETVLGYSHSIGPGVTFITEYLTVDKDVGTKNAGDEPQVLALVLKVDF